MVSRDFGTNSRRGLAAPGAILLLLVTLLTLAGERLSYLESTYYDFLQRQQTTAGSEQILLIDTDSDTTAGDIWDGALLTPIINALHKSGAALIVPVEPPPANTPRLDMDQLTALAELQNRARASGNDVVNDSIQSLDVHLEVLRQQYAQQKAIASTIKTAGNIILPISDDRPKWSRDNTTDVCQQHTLRTPNDESMITAPLVKEASSLLTLPDLLCESANKAGYGKYWPDRDGIVRRTHLLVKSGTRIFPSLSLAIAQADNVSNVKSDGNPAEGHLEFAGKHSIKVDDRFISTGPEYTRLLRFYNSVSGEKGFSTVSASDLLNGTVPDYIFRDRIVLIGDLESGKSGGYRTPSREIVPPAILLATALSNLLQMDFVSRPHWLGSAELAILFLLAVAILASMPVLDNNRAVKIIGLAVVLLLATEAYLLIAHGIWVQLVTVTLFSILGIASVQASSRFTVSPVAANTPARRSAPQAPIGNEDQLDLAFSVLRQQPPTEETKKRLYGIAVTHGKLKEYAKAERVLIYLVAMDPHYRDVTEKLKRLSGARKNPAAEDAAPEKEAKSGKTATKSGKKETLGRYQIDSVLGRGAMATVYLGTDPNINRKVAIKTIALAEEFSDEDLEAAKAQFKREAESAGRLNHPNIIAIYDTGEDANVAYLAMEYFEGKALNYYAQQANLLPPKWVLELAARAADALHYAHGQGVVHRDIKPANLLYDAATDTLKITDFGIARLTDTSRTKTGIILGTPSYMSPEQLGASAVTGKSDLYSLGITMYQLLTGTTPFRSDSIPKLMDKIINEKHRAVGSVRDDMPIGIDTILDQALAKDPDDRYPNGRAMALALRDCCGSF